MNYSLKEGKTPRRLEMCKRNGITQKGDSKNPSNYRPISLTCILCKLMESIVKDHIVDFMTRNLLFSDNQFEFMAKRSTVIQLLNVIDQWSSALDEGNGIDCVYFDFMKAFDTVAHKRLRNKLISYGISETFIRRILNFLTDRRQRVVVNGAKSSWKTVTSGTP